MNKTDIKTELEKNGAVICPSEDTSMMPLLRQGKDFMIIKNRCGEKLKVGDAVLCIRGNNYVLHRIVAEVSDGYLICGDNRKTAQHVFDGEIIGIMTGFIRDGKETSVEDPGYKKYVKAVLEFRQPVQNMKALASKSRKALRRILGNK